MKMDKRTNRNRTWKRKNELLSYYVIRAASEGDLDAMKEVVHHYEPYIKKLSTRTMYDDTGKAYRCVDETLRRNLEKRLIKETLAFEPFPHERAGRTEKENEC